MTKNYASYANEQELKRVHQERDETIIDFMNRVRLVATKACRDDSLKQREKRIISTFIGGLQDSQIALQFAGRKPHSSAEAKRVALSAEATRKELRSRKTAGAYACERDASKRSSVSTANRKKNARARRHANTAKRKVQWQRQSPDLEDPHLAEATCLAVGSRGLGPPALQPAISAESSATTKQTAKESSECLQAVQSARYEAIDTRERLHSARCGSASVETAKGRTRTPQVRPP